MQAIRKLEHHFFGILCLKNNDKDEDFAVTVGLSLSSPCSNLSIDHVCAAPGATGIQQR